jgi:hypothetical protein
MSESNVDGYRFEGPFAHREAREKLDEYTPSKVKSVEVKVVRGEADGSSRQDCGVRNNRNTECYE